MTSLKLNGVEVCLSELTQHSFRAAYCDFLLPINSKNRVKMLAEFARAGELGVYRGLRVQGVANLDFLSDFPDLLYLELVDQKRVDTKALAALTNLRGLRIESPGTGIDFSWFPELEVFVGDWHVDNCNLNKCQELRQLRTWQFKPRSQDLSVLAGITRLETLELTKTNVRSLAGLELLADVRYLDISYAPQLESLDAFADGKLELRELSIANAKNIASYLPIARLPRLRRLKLSSCRPMPDLHWTRGMQQLDFFSFVETNVESGDLSPLLDLPQLRYAGTMDKKHYNYKSDALNELLEKRTRAR